MQLCGSYDVDLRIFDKLLGNDPTVKRRDLEGAGGCLRCRLYFSDGMVSSQLIRDGIIAPIISWAGPLPEEGILDWLALALLGLPEVRRTAETEEMLSAISYGDTLLFAEGQSGCLIIGSKSFPYRAVSEPETEKVEKGPKEGFVEPLMFNISMIKRRLRSGHLRIDNLTAGDLSGTSICLLSLDGVTDPGLRDKVRGQLEKVRMDGILSSNYLAESIRPQPYAIFRRLGTTARPDVAVSKLLEGRVIILVDGSPQALTAPFIFLEYFQSPEDYYVSWHYAAFSRALRMAAFWLSISLAPIYVALLGFHPGTLPTRMLMDLAVMQQSAPFSFFTEALILLLAFDLLREAGLRAPPSIGQTLSVVGALVLGQSAVEASLVSPAMVIVVALSGVTGLITTELKDPIIFLRLGLLVLAGTAGLWGYVMGMALLVGRLSTIESWGVDYLSSMPGILQGSHEDSIFRKPFARMQKKGRFRAGGGK